MANNNVVTFPRPKTATHDSSHENLLGSNFVFRMLAFAFSGVRLAIYLVMFWLRGLVVSVLSFFSVISLIAFLFAWAFMPDQTKMVWGCGVMSFGCFAVAWAYDYVLMFVSPEPMTRLI